MSLAWARYVATKRQSERTVLHILTQDKVGLNVAKMAIGLGMRVEALDPYASPAIAQAANVTMVSNLSELLTRSDFLTIHTPLIASTKGMIGASELAQMKKGARVLNVARGGMIDESALLSAIEDGQIAGAALDVFTSEPPQPDGPAFKLISHPKVVATPHLGASTVEAQENVSIDVCEQVLSILSGDLPRSAVNAPLILPEEYRTLQPFVRLVEKMGSLYTQYYSAPSKSQQPSQNPQHQSQQAATTFDLVYEGALADISNTKPLYAALIKGLVAPISDSPEQVNIVNAELVAKTRGIVVNEQKSRAPPEHSFSSLVTLKARPTTASREPSPYRTRPAGSVVPSDINVGALSQQNQAAEASERSISGYVSNNQIFISRVDRYATSFAPEGNLLLIQNYDSPGAIGRVGGLLGKETVNINFMAVSPLISAGLGSPSNGITVDGEKSKNEALMILGIDREITAELSAGLGKENGILHVTAVQL